MCGILAIFGFKGDYNSARAYAKKLSVKLQHRGPDGSGLMIYEVTAGVFNIICHERLSIVDLSNNGKQPFEFQKNNQVICYAVNGEIYNHQKFRQELQQNDNVQFKSNSDSEIIGPLYQKYGIDMFDKLNGMWACIIYDHSKNNFIIGRDHVGIIPLYYGVGQQSEIYVSSEIKAIQEASTKSLEILQPGNYMTNDMVQKQWYNPWFYDFDNIPTKEVDYAELRQKLEEVVYEELQGDAPFGLFISGGLDSSLTAAIAVKLVKDGKISLKQKGMTEIHSFCVGVKDSEDIIAAQQVADFLGTTHHSVIYTAQEGIDAIPQAIYHMESFNNSNIRAGTAMYLLARVIKSFGIKYCLVGEGADEVFGGYLYFEKAPNAKEFHQECIRKVQEVNQFVLKRCNKICMAWGVEVRPPFLNKDFIDYAMSIRPEDKMVQNKPYHSTKYILRKAFEDKINPYLPEVVLWRVKEQFSNGVGFSWKKDLEKFAETIVSDQEYSRKNEIFPVNTPVNKEGFWYRKIFQSFFKSDSAAKTVQLHLGLYCASTVAAEWDSQAFKFQKTN